MIEINVYGYHDNGVGLEDYYISEIPPTLEGFKKYLINYGFMTFEEIEQSTIYSIYNRHYQIKLKDVKCYNMVWGSPSIWSYEE